MPHTTPSPYVPEIGETVRDVARNRVGEVMARGKEFYALRPLGGGREWDVAPSDIRPLAQDEVLRVRVAEANGRSTGRVSCRYCDRLRLEKVVAWRELDREQVFRIDEELEEHARTGHPPLRAEGFGPPRR
ncbi:hypothetical protein [Streptomyces sp. NPDC051162]|uniref:hypothetical protein n=1 Tax=Streptomyces sp. NPDC051162 TaxID=3154747 RepID=UPI00342A9982